MRHHLSNGTQPNNGIIILSDHCLTEQECRQFHVLTPAHFSPSGQFLPLENQLVRCESDGDIALSTLKQAENGDGWIVRLYNPHNRDTITSITFQCNIRKAFLVRLDETHESELAIIDHVLRLPLISAKSIVTFKFPNPAI
ncbi:MAG: glycosyl hydrolase-related protein [Candidatus Sumerlaeota bacterium]|nr:glycosyl hydrolase-related protein [Candidatus Sumerlaeota bacterium]